MANRTTEVFKSTAMVAPSLAIWVPTQKGWNQSSEIINSQLFSTQQLYAINNLRPLREFEMNNKVYAVQVAKYYALVARLLLDNGPLAAAVERGNAFVWSMRQTEGKDVVSQQPLPLHYTCHSWRSELCVAAYNLATAAVQWVVTQANYIHENVDILRSSLMLLAHAERIYFTLAQLVNLAAQIDVSSSSSSSSTDAEAVPPPFAQPQHLQRLADLAFAQLCELWYVQYEAQQADGKAVAMGISIVEAYEALDASSPEEAADNISIVPGFFQRMVAVKKRFCMLKCTELFLRQRDESSVTPEIMQSFAYMASDALKSLGKSSSSSSPLAAIEPAIRVEIEGIQVDYNLGAYTDSSATADAAWNFVKENFIAAVPPNSFRSPQAAKGGLVPLDSALALYRTLNEDFCIRLWNVAETNQWSGPTLNTDLVKRWNTLLAEYLPALHSAATTDPTLSDPRFDRKKNLVLRLRRLTALMKAMGRASSTLTGTENKLGAVLQHLQMQYVDYIRIIESVFFDHRLPASGDGTVVTARDITTLALAISSGNSAGVGMIDASVWSKTLDDDLTQPEIAKIESVEGLLREEIQHVLKFVPAGAPVTSS